MEWLKQCNVCLRGLEFKTQYHKKKREREREKRIKFYQYGKSPNHKNEQEEERNNKYIKPRGKK
jgi:hypothetical protein